MNKNQDRSEEAQPVSTRLCVYHTGRKSIGSLNLQLYVYITKSLQKSYEIEYSLFLFKYTRMTEIEKIFIYCMFRIQTKQNTLTSSAQGTLFNMVIKHFLMIILELLMGIIKVYLRSWRVKNGKKERQQTRGQGINANTEDEEKDLMEELPLTLEILFLRSPKQCKQFSCLNSTCLWNQQHGG